jgi:hypothetical protein
LIVSGRSSARAVAVVIVPRGVPDDALLYALQEFDVLSFQDVLRRTKFLMGFPDVERLSGRASA